MTRDTFLVTGGAGYVGSHLTRMLLAAGHRVRVLERFLYGDQGLAAVRDHPHLEIHVGDVCCLHNMEAAVSGCRAVIALAALVGDAACEVDRTKTMAINFESTKSLVDACRQHAVERLVFASSCSVYGANGSHLLTEDSHLNPVSLYARTRIKSEEILARERGDLDVIVLRLATVCGLSPRMRFDLMVNTITARAAVDQRVKIVGAQQWRPHLHVQDAAAAFMCAAQAPPRSGFSVFNVGADDQNFTIAQIAAKVLEQLPTTEVEYADGVNDSRSYRVCFDRVRQELGFRPRHRVEDAIREVRSLLLSEKSPNYRASPYHNALCLRENGVAALAERDVTPPR